MTNPFKDLALEAGKSFAKTAGTKAGEKLVDKVFASKPIQKAPSPIAEVYKLPVPVKKTKTSVKQDKPKKQIDVMKDIYGDGLFKKSKQR